MNEAEAPSGRLLRERAFILLWLTRLFGTIGYQALAIVIGWSIYAITGSAFDLGLVGLLQFIPAVVLTLLIGHAADRYDRRLIVRLAQSVYAICAAIVTAAMFAGWLTRDLLFAIVFMIGCARAFELPTGHSLVPATVPASLLPRAVAAWTSANQVAVICGPALGGFLYAVEPRAVSALCVVFFVAAVACVSAMRIRGNVPSRDPPTLRSALAGFDFIRSRSRLLGVITLDLFVVLLGGATALLPVFAKDILAAGPTGLGLLRSAPAIGALLTAIVLSRVPIERHLGRKMFISVAVFGIATVAFGLSTNLPLSMLALAVLGASDAVSVVIRFSLVQIETPDHMRGRVSAINYLFVGSSNTLGDFEAGAVAGWLGAVNSVLIGGIGSLIVAGLWMGLFPDLRHLDRYQPAEENDKS
ncbi:MAG: MFS transporter [Proteobacteria bacterium]|nr:MFS transporter [Pseudomonadota bacterium]